jgi:hypothetical protein
MKYKDISSKVKKSKSKEEIYKDKNQNGNNKILKLV